MVFYLSGLNKSSIQKMNILLENINKTYKLGLEEYNDEIITISIIISAAFFGLAIYEYLDMLKQRR